ncbi:MAG: polysaccharide biosynthesis C-terminal domain-containing protein [Acidobacteria bacterium]|nr:polysaccharide biosynthesis C-terminal domain-containing protein [Acidobacteriota bacterium]
MPRIEKSRIVKNVGSNGMALAINVVVGIFLSPFILHRLGDAAFGIWVLIFSITGYYGLLDLGIRSSVVRYVSKAKALGCRDNLGKVISTSLCSYSAIGALAFCITIVVSSNVGQIFRIPPEFHSTARWLLLIVGSAVSLGFPLGVWGGVLEGFQRFDILSLTDISVTLVRALLIVIALRHGHGLLTLAGITAGLPILASIVRGLFALRLLRIRLALALVNWQTLREIANYSGISFILIISARLRFKSDEIIIGTFLSSAAITYFNIGDRIVDYAEEVVETFAQTLVSMSSQFDATGERDRLRQIFLLGNRVCAFITLPITAILLILGKSIIEAWVGRAYVAQSYPVLVLMAAPSALAMAQSASVRILFGMGKHQTWAMVTLVEALVNVVLSIWWVHSFGIVGSALGTTLPLAVTMIFFLPKHICRELEVAILTYLREAYALPVLLCIPMVGTLLAMKLWFVPHNYLELAVQLAVAGTVYGIGLFWAFKTEQLVKMSHLQEVSRSELRIEPRKVQNYSH